MLVLRRAVSGKRIVPPREFLLRQVFWLPRRHNARLGYSSGAAPDFSDFPDANSILFRFEESMGSKTLPSLSISSMVFYHRFYFAVYRQFLLFIALKVFNAEGGGVTTAGSRLKAKAVGGEPRCRKKIKN